jgi:hypothetical protein
LRLQLIIVAIAAAAPSGAWADDSTELSTTWYQEARQGGKGGLTVIHPQFDLGADLGETVSLALGYSADAVTGATATVYAVDAISTATTFTDTRHEGRISLGFRGKRSVFSVAASVGTERDYESIAVLGSAAIDLPGRNTNVALTYGHNFDQVCDKDNADVGPLERHALTGADPCPKKVIIGIDEMGDTSVWRDLSIDTTQATITQNLSPTSNLQVSLYGQVLSGFQSNPYRRVRVGANEPQEHIPDTRARGALEARYNRFLPKLRSAIHASLRGYSDTWGVNSGTAELAYSQYAGSSLLLRFRARVYQQSAATFFKDAFFYETEAAAGEYFTGDRELAPVRNVLVGAKLTLISASDGDHEVWGLFDKLQFNLKGDVLLLDELPADDPTANQSGTGSQFLTSGQFLDAFVLSLGLFGSY